MSSTVTLHVCAAGLILLFAIFSNVHSWHKKTLNHSSMQDDRKTQAQQDSGDSYHNRRQRPYQRRYGFREVPDKPTFHEKERNLSYSALEVSETNVSFVSRRENVTNSTTGVYVANTFSPLENVTNSTLHVHDIYVNSVTRGESVSNFTSDVIVTNVIFSTFTDNESNSASNVKYTNVTTKLLSDNESNVISDMKLQMSLVTNVTSSSTTDNESNSASNVKYTNVTTKLLSDNESNVISDMKLQMSLVTNVTSSSTTDNESNSISNVIGTNVTLTLLTDESNNSNFTSGVLDTNVTSASLTDNESNTTSNVTDTNVAYASLAGESKSTVQITVNIKDLPSETDSSYSSAKSYSAGDNFTFDTNNTNSNFNYKYNYSSANLNITSNTEKREAKDTTSSEWTGDFPSYLEEAEGNYWSNDSFSNHSSSENNSSDLDPLNDSTCVTCRMRAIDRHYRILQFKNQILNSLHITNIPNITGIPIPKVPALTHLYEMEVDMMKDAPNGKRKGYGRNDEYDDDFVVKTERVFISAKEAPLALHLNLTDTVYFPPAVQLFTSDIKSAHLWFYIRKHDVPPPYVTIERILPQSKPGRTFVTKKVFSIKLSKEKAFGWKRVNMKELLSQWVRHPMTNFGLQIKAEDNSGNNLIVLPPASDIDKGYEPWLDTKIVEQRHNSRRRRSESLMCVENSTDSRCCRHPLLVGFAEFGWDWIIAPTHVNADYCTGECRMTMQDNTPYSWVNQQMPGTNSCCTPTKLSPLPLLYFDESMNVVYQILQNMKVDKCGCA